jgi:NAD(P)-dependent dehydrogenase (short-subunit alcohol dehydrogenase family)
MTTSHQHDTKPVVVVTGGGRGIGEGVARLMAEKGYHVAIIDRDAHVGINVANKINTGGGKSAFYQADVSNAAQVNDAFSRIVADFERIDALSCNAGIQRYGTVESTTEEGWDEVLDVNLKSMFLCSKAAVPHLKETKGSIVIMSSVQGYATQKNVLAYTTSKHALVGFVRAMALDLAEFGVRVNGVAPGSVRTPMLEHTVSMDANPDKLWKVLDNMHPLGRIGTPREIAEVVAFLASPASSFVTGSMIIADGGLLLPIAGSPKED